MWKSLRRQWGLDDGHADIHVVEPVQEEERRNKLRYGLPELVPALNVSLVRLRGPSHAGVMSDSTHPDVVPAYGERWVRTRLPPLARGRGRALLRDGVVIDPARLRSSGRGLLFQR